MKCKTVMQRFHKLVPFPVTPEKIKAAGYDVTTYLKLILQELSECDDLSESPRAQAVRSLVNELSKLAAAGE